jgi:hypothetical protein
MREGSIERRYVARTPAATKSSGMQVRSTTRAIGFGGDWPELSRSCVASHSTLRRRRAVPLSGIDGSLCRLRSVLQDESSAYS